MLYEPTLVQPMRDELTRIGVQELCTVEEVDEVIGRTEGTTLVVVNSVCGCAARNARLRSKPMGPSPYCVSARL